MEVCAARAPKRMPDTAEQGRPAPEAPRLPLSAWGPVKRLTVPKKRPTAMPVRTLRARL